MTRLFACAVLLSSVALAEKGGVYELRTSQGQGSCTAIDTPADTRQHFLTIEHALRGNNLSVIIDGKRHACELVETWPAKPEPVVMIRTVDEWKGHVATYPIAASGLVAGQKAFTVGFQFGRYRGEPTHVRDVQTAFDSYYVTSDIMDSGSSGGAVLNTSGEIVGVIQSVDPRRRVTLSTNIVAATNKFAAVKTVRWQCTPRGCYPIYAQQQPPAFRVYERGRVGIFGGRVERYIETPVSPTTPAQPSVDREEILAEVRITVVDWLEKNREQLRGADGRNGSDGLNGKDATQLTVQQIADYLLTHHSSELTMHDSRVDDVLMKLKALGTRRVVLVDGTTKKVIDDESYGPDEPIVLDIRRLQAAK